MMIVLNYTLCYAHTQHIHAQTANATETTNGNVYISPWSDVTFHNLLIWIRDWSAAGRKSRSLAHTPHTHTLAGHNFSGWSAHGHQQQQHGWCEGMRDEMRERRREREMYSKNMRYPIRLIYHDGSWSANQACIPGSCYTSLTSINTATIDNRDKIVMWLLKVCTLSSRENCEVNWWSQPKDEIQQERKEEEEKKNRRKIDM